ncbi:hypothetical protein [Actinosynnema sp. NPDC020468]|uniref:hypothetical protein n=1 Tax=Actinosynnema sp. NPDC020468 TaxID=3154488 RepID=UPI0034065CB7
MTEVQTRRPEAVVSRLWRGLSGAVTAGLVLLALALIGVQVYAGTHDLPGPGIGVVIAHVVAAAAAVVAQVFADRTRGWAAAGLGLAVLVLAGVTLWIFWWA